MVGSLTGPASFVGMVIVMLFMVPRVEITRFLWMGLVGGLFLAILLLSIMQNLLGFWIFGDVDFLYLYNIPIALSAVWMPMVITFSYLVSLGVHNMARIAALIVIFASIPVIAHWFLLTQGLLVYIHWSLIHTFMLASAIHVMLYGYLYLSSYVKH